MSKQTGASGAKRRRQPSAAGPVSPDALFDHTPMLAAIEKMLDVKLDRMEERIGRNVKAFEKKLEELAEALNSHCKLTEERMKEIDDKIKKEKQERESEIDRLNAYIMRENSVLLGLPETENEDTDKVVRAFYKDNLKLEEDFINNIEHQRIHRVRSAIKPRPIKIRFLRYQDKLKVHGAAKNLKGTSFYLTDDLPKRIRDERKRKMNQLKEAREEGKIAFFSRTEPWKLVIQERRVSVRGTVASTGAVKSAEAAGMRGVTEVAPETGTPPGAGVKTALPMIVEVEGATAVPVS